VPTLDFAVRLSGRKILDAILVGSRPPRNDGVWEAAKQNGFQVTIFNRSGGEEKSVDTELVARGTEIICSTSKPQILVIASGDRDFIPLVNVAHRRGWEVEMCAFTSAFSPTGEMATSVERVRALDADYLGMENTSSLGPCRPHKRWNCPC
jgi:NYN domain